MLFNSYTFLLFFAVVLGVYCFPLPWRIKKFHLLVASYLFYAAWNPPFVLLLWISTVVDWYCARWMHATSSRRVRWCFLCISLGVNLGFLAFFKYADFLMENFTALAAAVGFNLQSPRFDIVLPVGISFYTFQSLSYTIDVFRRRLKPWDSPLDFALYVSFFPQLVAGPIVRAVEFLPQCTQPKCVSSNQLGWGLSLFTLGLFQKIVIADGLLAPVVGKVYESVNQTPDFHSAWCGTLAFSGQIFCDFAGYSTCAVGVAMCFGFALPDNFRFPYAATGFSDFWQRWHISLSTWLRDYLYISLGGNRRGAVRTYVNLGVTMLLGGLWHGASWTFVVWGALHGTFLIVERTLRNTALAQSKVWQTYLGKLTLVLGTFVAVCFTWVFFRADSFSKAFVISKAMLGTTTGGAVLIGELETLQVFLPVGLILLFHWLLREKTLEDVVAKCPSWLLSLVLAMMIIAIVMMPGEDRAFIYFQF